MQKKGLVILMKIHEYGKPERPFLLLLPGTCCYWKANFENVLEGLTDDFRVGIVAYSGFDESGSDEFTSMEEETEKLEAYIKEHYHNEICAAYGCSLGGSFVALLAARQNISMKYGIIGSSDFDQSGVLSARLKAALMGKLLYPYIHTGRYSISFIQKRMDQRLAEPDPYNKAFLSIVGTDRYDMSFISKNSLKNQFYSDLITPIPDHIPSGNAEIHVFYAKKMGEKYLARYRQHFQDPVIHEHDLRHEELLGVYPEQWTALVKEICLK